MPFWYETPHIRWFEKLAVRQFFNLIFTKFVPTCHHCSVISHIRPQCSMLKKEQNLVARSLPKKPSRPKHIVCHHCGAFRHLRPHCSKFQALKRIKRKEKLELLGSCALQAKLDLIESVWSSCSYFSHHVYLIAFSLVTLYLSFNYLLYLEGLMCFVQVF